MADQTVEVPETVVERSQFDVSGAGYEPGAHLAVRLEHDSGWHLNRKVLVGIKGKFALVSNAHVPGTIQVVVETDAPSPITLAAATLKVTAAPDEDDKN